MPLAPIEVLVINFPGNQFTGGIIPELERLVNENIISVIDGVLVRRDGDGAVTYIEFEEMVNDEATARLAALVNELQDLISEDDVLELAATLEPDSSQAILVFEHTWARPLRDAIVDSGGVLANNFRVPGAVVDEVLAAVAEG
jgi:uncharacterized membrane protein